MSTNYRHIITDAYLKILLRPPDPGGLDSYQAQMLGGMTEAEMRESMIRSPEFAEKFGGGAPPPPTPGGMSPLSVRGNRFFNQGGEVVKLLGMVVCCDDPNTPEDEALARGWPLVDFPTLDAIADHKLNFTSIRLGPSISRDIFGEGEGSEFVGYAQVGNRYNLNAWNPAFWERVRACVGHAASRGIYVMVSLIDSWVLDHQLTPWTASRNDQAYEGGSLEVVKHAPSPVHEAWIRKAVAEVGAYPNVLFLDGNESFKGHPSTAWVHGIRDIVRAELTARGYSARPFGTNSGITEEVDFINMHDRGIPPAGALPIIVDEYGTRPVEQILIDARRGWEGGSVTYAYWRGEHSLADTARTLDGLKSIVEGGGAGTFPDSCPRLVRWQPKVHIVMDGHRRLLEDGVPVETGFVFLDSTPRFGGGNGRPCNDEHNEECGGRPCEDPRGGIWTQTQGSAQVRVENPGDDGHGYQCLVGPLGPPGSTYTLKIEALPDAKDALGKPLTVAPGHGREVSFTVGQRTSGAADTAFLAEEEAFRPIPPGIIHEGG